MTAWHARMIAPDATFDAAPLLRHEFALETGHGEVRRATLRLTARGVVEATLGGIPASPDLLTPGWSAYEWRLRYSETDVTSLVAPTTVVVLALGNGWYRGRLGWLGGEALYGDEIAALAELRIVFADGHEQVVGTDESWRAGPGATTANDLYDGQDIDARRLDPAWHAPGFSSEEWTGVHAVDLDLATLEPYIGPPVRRQEDAAPVEIVESPSGRVLLDFGQNLVGFARVSVRGTRGRTVTLRHAEVLDRGELAVVPLRSARATDRFTLSGGDDVFEPTLTFHGFRYLEVEGWPGGIEALRREGGITAVVVGSDLRRIGTFESSNALLDRLHENAVWGMRGNFLDVPTDCPQRDERLGWTGDLAVFAPSAAYLFDVGDFLRDWLRDLALEQQHQDGIVPVVIPDAMKYFDLPPGFPTPEATAIWGDAAVWVPWAVWTASGDRRVLDEAFPSMAAHTRRISGLLSPSGLWDTGSQLGDWLDPDAPPEAPQQAKADPYVVATLCAIRTSGLTARAAAVVGDTEAEAEFDALATRIRDAFLRHYWEDGRIRSDCVTVYALAVAFGVLEGEDRAHAGDRLAELVRESGHRIATGFAGTPFVTDALTETGHLNDAYRLLLQTESPSWLYPVTMGATTIWERWDSMPPDGSINSGEMTSFNHYALGAVVDWLHRSVAGLSPLEPGYRRILFAPHPGGGLSWARARLETPHGEAAISWREAGGTREVELRVPAGATAVLRLPGLPDEELRPGEHRRVWGERIGTE